MPFIQIHDVDASDHQRRSTARAVTDAVVAAYAVDPETVDIVFHGHAVDRYGRAGRLPASHARRRTFVTLHAFARSTEKRREAARLLTTAVAAGLEVAPDSVVIYMLEPHRDEAAHGGVLASDEGAP